MAKNLIAEMKEAVKKSGSSKKEMVVMRVIRLNLAVILLVI